MEKVSYEVVVRLAEGMGKDTMVEGIVARWHEFLSWNGSDELITGFFF